MNVKPGGAQPPLHDTVWNGRVQKLVDRRGVPKGMKQVLEERGVPLKGEHYCVLVHWIFELCDLYGNVLELVAVPVSFLLGTILQRSSCCR